MGLRHLIAAGCAATVIGLVACGGGVESSCGNYLDALASHETACGATVNVPSTTKNNFEKLCGAVVTVPGVSNFGGQIDQCASKLGSSDCNGSVNCKLTGTLPDGAACGIGAQCAGGICNQGQTPAPNSELVCGTCASPIPVGGDCSSGDCDTSVAQCIQNKCVAYVQQGASCANAPCATGLQCDNGTQTCQPLPTKGQPCTFDCAYPEICEKGTCADPAQQGGPCPTGVECASGLQCDTASHTCVQPTKAAAGQPCGFVNNQIVECDSGLACSGQTQTCVAPKEIGDACTVGKQECDVFLFCIGGTCQVPDYSVCK